MSGRAQEDGEGLSAYEIRHLVAHLVAAGRLTDVAHLMVLDSEGSSLWELHHRRAGNAFGFRDDVLAAAEAFGEADERSMAEHGQAPFLGDEIFCRLAVASLDGRVNGLGPGVVRTLVERGQWTFDEAMQHAPSFTALTRLPAVAALMRFAPAEAEAEPSLGELLQALREVLGQLSRLADTVVPRAVGLRTLRSCLAELADDGTLTDTVDHATGVVQSWPPSELRALLLVLFARSRPHFDKTAKGTGGDPWLQAFEAVASLDDEADRAAVFHEVALELPWQLPPLFLTMLPKVRRLLDSPDTETGPMDDIHLRAAGMAQLRMVTTALEREGSSALPRALEVCPDAAVIQLLPALAKGCPEGLDARTVLHLRDRMSRYRPLQRIEGFAQLAPLSPPEVGRSLIAEAVRDLLAGESFDSDPVIMSLAPLPVHVRRHATSLGARDVADDTEYARATDALAPHLDLRDLKTVVDRLGRLDDLDAQLTAAAALAGISDRATVTSLMTSAPHVPELDDLLMHPGHRRRFLAAVAPHLSEAVLQQQLTEARRVQGPAQRAWSLAECAAQLSGRQRHDVLAEALEAVGQVRSKERAEALQPIAGHLAGDEKLLGRAYKLAVRVINPSDRGDAIRCLLPHLPPKLLTKALQDARKLPERERELDDRPRVRTLAALVPVLDHARRARVVDEVVTGAIDSPEVLWLCSLPGPVLNQAARYLSASRLRQLAADAARIDAPYGRGVVLAHLSPSLPAGLQTSVVQELLDRGTELTAYGDTRRSCSSWPATPTSPRDIVLRALDTLAHAPEAPTFTLARAWAETGRWRQAMGMIPAQPDTEWLTLCAEIYRNAPELRA